MSYKYDVFLSYVHEFPCVDWVTEHLVRFFQFELSNALNRKARVFFDRTNIQIGDRWPAKLRDGLAHSRCLLGIWNPAYFRSMWCLTEVEVMRHREVKIGFGTIQHPGGLIMGINVNDGQHFPAFAREVQYANFQDYFIVGLCFSAVPEYAKFQKAIQELAPQVAAVVESAPDWSPDWLTAPWLDDVVARVQSPPSPKAEQPILG